MQIVWIKHNPRSKSYEIALATTGGSFTIHGDKILIEPEKIIIDASTHRDDYLKVQEYLSENSD